MRYNLLIIIIVLLMGCGSMNISDSYYHNVKKTEANRINKEYAKVEFNGVITQKEAEAIFNKFVLDNGWPWKMMGGNTKPIDNGHTWAIKFMSDIGLVNETQPVFLIDKKTGKITSSQSAYFEMAQKKIKELGMDVENLECRDKSDEWKKILQKRVNEEQSTELFQKLANKDFVAINCGPKDIEVLGGTITIFIDRETDEIIDVLRGQ